MNIIIVGCGKVGSTLARQLSKEGHNISIIDINDRVVEEFSNTHDVMGIIGNGAAYSIQKAAGIERASGEPNRKKVAKVSKDKVKEIAEFKMKDLNAASIEAAMRMVEGTARSMGIEIEG